MTRSTRIAAGVAAAALLGSVAAAVFASGRGGGSARPSAPTAPTASTRTTAAPVAGAGAGGAELVSLLAQGRKATFHASYRASAPRATTSQDAVLELWRKASKEREEIVQATGIRTVRSAGFLLGSQSILCRQVDAGPWTCANSPQSNQTDTEGLVKGVTAELAAQATAGRDDQIASTPVRCFSVPTSGQPSELCLTSDGVTARVSTAGSSIELVALSRDVPDDVFVPPAPVS